MRDCGDLNRETDIGIQQTSRNNGTNLNQMPTREN